MIIAIAICLGVISAVWVAWNLTLDALWQPTDKETVRRILVLAQVHQGETVFDLGCGDGRIVIAAARWFGARGVGIEIDPARVLWARFWAFLMGVSRSVEIRLKDMYKVDLGRADVVVIFLSSKANQKLQDKLYDQLHRGARIVSYYHPLRGWKPARVGQGRNGHAIYLYCLPGSMKNLTSGK
jgi:SAM-dependent methyltransferase